MILLLVILTIAVGLIFAPAQTRGALRAFAWCAGALFVLLLTILRTASSGLR